jgi:hypothetical protein
MLFPNPLAHPAVLARIVVIFLSAGDGASSRETSSQGGVTQSRVDLDARGPQRGAVPVDAGAAAQHRDRSTDDGDPLVTKPEQMPRRREPPAQFVAPTVATLGSGS